MVASNKNDSIFPLSVFFFSFVFPEVEIMCQLQHRFWFVSNWQTEWNWNKAKIERKMKGNGAGKLVSVWKMRRALKYWAWIENNGVYAYFHFWYFFRLFLFFNDNNLAWNIVLTTGLILTLLTVLAKKKFHIL